MLHFMLNIHQFNSFPRKFADRRSGGAMFTFIYCPSSKSVDNFVQIKHRQFTDYLRYSQHSQPLRENMFRTIADWLLL